MNKPKYHDYHTNEGIHNAMQDYARSFDKPSLVAHVTFEDGTLIETFEHATRELYYRVFNKDEGLYAVDIHTAKYKEAFFSNKDNLTSKEIKEGYTNWLKQINPNDKFSIKWSKGAL